MLPMTELLVPGQRGHGVGAGSTAKAPCLPGTDEHSRMLGFPKAQPQVLPWEYSQTQPHVCALSSTHTRIYGSPLSHRC